MEFELYCSKNIAEEQPLSRDHRPSNRCSSTYWSTTSIEPVPTSPQNARSTPVNSETEDRCLVLVQCHTSKSALLATAAQQQQVIEYGHVQAKAVQLLL